ncbi:uncharacterized protein JCM10292_007531 [Rhodotorula paludigena]|uniref:uncharacterized protein n=1 Tax=Rhodotorula paludigena TaxID=86838 RepID=UPI00317B5313
MASPSYVPYTPQRSASSISALQLPGSSAVSPPPHGPSPLGGTTPSRTSSGIVRPASRTLGSDSAGQGLRAPQPTRPAQLRGLSGAPGSGAAGGQGAFAARQHATPPPGPTSPLGSTPASPPPPGTSARPTPPPSTFPFSSVSASQSPFSPGTPERARSPEKGPVAQLQLQHAAGDAGARGGRARSPRRMPYQAGFQPQGVRRDRSDEFAAQRGKCSEARKLDEGRLARRLEKLIALHFPAKPEVPAAVATPKSSPLYSLTSFSDSLRGRSAKELWRTAVGNVDIDVERAEQAIVKWQDDHDATHCPICTYSASFGVRARRHHCRLCGRVVCFLPPTPLSQYPEPTISSPIEGEAPTAPTKPIRRERCSTFITYEYQALSSGSSEEKKPYGVVVEIPPVEQDLSIDAVLGPTGGPKQKKEHDERKKVRVCRDCLNTVMRQQLKTLPIRTPTWLKLHEVLIQLEKEIDEVLPEFQELAVTLSNPVATALSASPPSANHAKQLRKRLLTDLASYDTIAKRIRDLPLPEHAPPNGSQDRLQRALASRGALYLSEKLGLLRSLGNVEELGGGAKGKKKKEQGGAAGAGSDGKQGGEYTVQSLASLLGKDDVDKVTEKVGPELEAAAKLNVLREQEALVKSYVDDANARRQFEDAAALEASLDELRAEIAAISATLP